MFFFSVSLNSNIESTFFIPHFLFCIQIFWSDSGELVCIATEESFFILRYMADKVAASQENNEGITEDGIEDAFEVGSLIQFIVIRKLKVSVFNICI